MDEPTLRHAAEIAAAYQRAIERFFQRHHDYPSLHDLTPRLKPGWTLNYQDKRLLKFLKISPE